jgi:hypothetical protein
VDFERLLLSERLFSVFSVGVGTLVVQRSASVSACYASACA